MHLGIQLWFQKPWRPSSCSSCIHFCTWYNGFGRPWHGPRRFEGGGWSIFYFVLLIVMKSLHQLCTNWHETQSPKKRTTNAASNSLDGNPLKSSRKNLWQHVWENCHWCTDIRISETPGFGGRHRSGTRSPRNVINHQSTNGAIAWKSREGGHW